MKYHPRLFAALLTLIACSSSDDDAPSSQTDARVDAAQAAAEAGAKVEAIAKQIDAPACALDDGANRVGEVLAWPGTSGETTLAGRHREA